MNKVMKLKQNQENRTMGKTHVGHRKVFRVINKDESDEKIRKSQT